MKNNLRLSISLLMIIIFLSSCSESTQTKTTSVKDATEVTNPLVKSSGDSYVISEINNQIKGFSIDGFPKGSSKLNRNEDLENMKKIVSIVKPLIDRIPDGYVMQITGHCTNYNSKSTQKRVSTARAAKIYNELKKSGADAKKMSYKGVGTDEPLENYKERNAKQRRVSFMVIKN